jgi:hypothetical protein
VCTANRYIEVNIKSTLQHTHIYSTRIYTTKCTWLLVASTSSQCAYLGAAKQAFASSYKQCDYIMMIIMLRCRCSYCKLSHSCSLWGSEQKVREKEVLIVYNSQRPQLTLCPCRLISYQTHINNSSSSPSLQLRLSSTYSSSQEELPAPFWHGGLV